MTWLASFRRRVRALVSRHRMEEELDDELRFHLEMAVAERVASGESAAAARRRVLRDFGGVERVKEECRDERGVAWLESFGQDLQYGVRSLAKSPGYTLAVVITLALGIGANTAIFSVVHGVLLQPLPYEEGERLIRVTQRALPAGVDDLRFSVDEIADYRDRSSAFDALVEYHDMTFTLLGRGDSRESVAPEQVRTGVVSADFFDVLGIEPLHGRAFQPADDRPEAPAVLVLSHPYWRRAFAGDPAAVGQTVEMNDRVHTVIGVLPPVPQYPDDNDVYMPTSACPFRSNPDFIANRRARMMSVFGRLAHGVGVGRAGSEAATVATALAAEHPDVYPPAAGYDAVVTPLSEELTHAARPTLLVLLGTVGLVLLVACANVANLTLARRHRRERELAVRSALGAGRGRLARQLLTEAGLLAAAGGALGLGLAVAVLDLLVAFAARYTPRAVEIDVDPAVLAFTAGMSLAAGLTFGALPALSRRAPARGLMGGGGGRVTGGALRRGLVVAQVAVALVVLAGAGLAARSLWALHRVDAGFETADVMTAMVDLNWSKYDRPELNRAFFQQLLERLEGPSVDSVAVAGSYPLRASAPMDVRFRIEGREPPAGELAPLCDTNQVSAGYFETLGVPLVTGRGFSSSDHEEAPLVVIVNRALARRHWGAESPVGRRLALGDDGPWRTVVGVVGDTRQHGLDRASTAEIYLPFVQVPGRVMQVLIRGRETPARSAERIRNAVAALDSEQPIAQVRTLGQVRAEALAPPRLTAALLAVFALLALAITATGVAGLLAFSVSQRTHEIGVRMALGARRGRVLGMVVGQGLSLAAAGAAVGLAAAFGSTRALSGLLFDVRPNDPWTLAAVTLALLAVAAAASLLPARRATSIDPVRALKSE